MFFKRNINKRQNVPVSSSETAARNNHETVQTGKAQRSYYERIAEGHALAEIEEKEQRKWLNK